MHTLMAVGSSGAIQVLAVISLLVMTGEPGGIVVNHQLDG